MYPIFVYLPFLCYDPSHMDILSDISSIIANLVAIAVGIYALIGLDEAYKKT